MSRFARPRIAILVIACMLFMGLSPVGAVSAATVDNAGSSPGAGGGGTIAPTAVNSIDELYVNAAIDALDFSDIKGLNASETEITDNLTLPSVGLLGKTTITWTSSDTETISPTGVVNLPAFGGPNINVILTALVCRNEAQGTKVFNLTVLPGNAASDLEDVQAALDALTFDDFRGTNEATDTITANLGTLPANGGLGTSITWESSDADTIDPVTSVVNRPDDEDKTVALTATVSKGSQHGSKEFSLKVLKTPVSDEDAVADSKTALTFDVFKGENTAPNNITNNLGSLPETGTASVVISWTSTETETINPENSEVIRPAFGQSDRPVTLTATLSKGIVEPATKDFALIVKAKEPTDEQAVDAALADLDFNDFKDTNPGEDTVTANLATLPTNGGFDTFITWTSDDTDTINPTNSEVNRPGIGSNKTVNLEATVGKGCVFKSEIYKLTVVALNAAESVAADKDWLVFDVIKGENELESSITAHLTLPKKGQYNSSISWSSTAPAVIDADTGQVTRPLPGDPDVQITLTATISSGIESTETAFSLTVKPGEITEDWQAVFDALEALTFDDFKGLNTSQDNITSDLDPLPTTGESTTTITWTSDSTATVDPATGDVLRPAFSAGDKTVTLTATASKGAAQDTKTFTLIIEALDPTDEEAVAAALARLTFDVIKGSNTSTDTITSDLNLPTTGESTTTITWTSDDTSTINPATGDVTRPAVGQQNKNVVLTATVSKGSESDSKTFNLTVLAQTPSGGGGGGGGGDTTPPAAPTGLALTLAPNGIQMTWNANAESDLAGYNAYRMTGTSTVKLNSTVLATTAFIDTTPALNVRYTYFVRAVDRSGNESANSNQINATYTVVAGDVVFSDVPSGAWYGSFLSTAIQNGVVSGYPNGTFKPNQAITRAEFAKMITVAMKWTTTSTASTFPDVANNHWALPYINAARGHNAVNGYPNGEFRPSNSISRAEVAKIVAMALNLSSGSSSLTDISNHWARDFIARNETAGILNGYPDRTFKPNAVMTRAEAVKVLALVMNRTS